MSTSPSGFYCDTGGISDETTDDWLEDLLLILTPAKSIQLFQHHTPQLQILP
jgi:hypothetical protein